MDLYTLDVFKSTYSSFFLVLKLSQVHFKLVPAVSWHNTINLQKLPSFLAQLDAPVSHWTFRPRHGINNFSERSHAPGHKSASQNNLAPGSCHRTGLKVIYFPHRMAWIHFFSFIEIKLISKHYMWLKCTSQCFDIRVHGKIITKIKLINKSITSQLPFSFLCVCVCWVCLRSALLANVKDTVNTVLLSIAAMLDIRSPELFTLHT